MLKNESGGVKKKKLFRTLRDKNFIEDFLKKRQPFQVIIVFITRQYHTCSRSDVGTNISYGEGRGAEEQGVSLQ